MCNMRHILLIHHLIITCFYIITFNSITIVSFMPNFMHVYTSCATITSIHWISINLILHTLANDKQRNEQTHTRRNIHEVMDIAFIEFAVGSFTRASELSRIMERALRNSLPRKWPEQGVCDGDYGGQGRRRMVKGLGSGKGVGRGRGMGRRK